jgi:hypothetical protein
MSSVQKITVLFNFPFISSNIPASPAFGVYISQLIRYSRACDQYSDFLDRAHQLTQKLPKQDNAKHKEDEQDGLTRKKQNSGVGAGQAVPASYKISVVLLVYSQVW